MLKDTKERYHFTRRAFVLGGAQLLLLSSLSTRLYYLQAVKGAEYTTQAEGNRIRLFPVLPPRGTLFDRNGNIIAEGEMRYQVLFDNTMSEEPEETVTRLSDILSIDFQQQETLLKKIAQRDQKGPVLVEANLPWEKIAKIEVNAPLLPGVHIAAPEIRYYPYGEVTSHITGYTGVVSQNDIKDSPLYKHPDFRIGKTGVEKTMEERLQGVAGVKQMEVNARGAFVRELAYDSGVSGENLTLTIDVELQKFVMEQLSGKGGLYNEGASAVVVDVFSGDVIAMGSVPTFDANQFVEGVKADYWQSLLNNPDSPLTNKAVSMHYPPGSTFKTLVAIAALEEGIITKDKKIYCPGYYEMGNRRFHCWERRGHGHLNLAESLAQSCNVYYYKIARELGVEKIAEMAHRFGLGQQTGIELPSERSGLVPDKDWKRRTMNDSWYIGETLNTGIGQGYLLVTPLQMAVMAARIASGGKRIEPRLVIDSSSDSYEMVALDTGEKILLPSIRRDFPYMNISRDHIESVKEGMSMAVNNSRGLVYPNRIQESHYAMAGKTGTAQVISDKTFKFTPKNKEERYHALFIGYAPIDSPRYAVSVVVEHGGYGSSIAAPIGKEILLKAQKLGKDD